MKVKNTMLVNASDMTSEYNALLLEALLTIPQMKKGNTLNFKTNLIIQSNEPIFVVFNQFLKKLHLEGTERIIINL